MATRDEIVMLRVSTAERRLLEAAAAANDRKLATWTRQAAVATALRRLLAEQSTEARELIGA